MLKASECTPNPYLGRLIDLFIHRYSVFLGCQGIDLSNTSDYYARYTTSTICNGLVQRSGDDCELSEDQLRPLCADDCVRMLAIIE
jgi:hypothetical protein